jgi:hypothetical protein
MTEAEWLACVEPQKMITSVCVWRLHTFSELAGDLSGRRNNTDRQFRLFACASMRLAWHLMTNPNGRRAVALAEHYADGEVSSEELVTVRAQIESFSALGRTHRIANRLARLISVNVMRIRPTEAGIGVTDHYARLAALRSALEATNLLLAENLEDLLWPGYQLSNIFRDIFGNPFRSVSFFPEWRTDTAVALAQQMYDSRDFSAMPILGDALQDAGCENEEILAHCRGRGPHVLGCWVIDLVLAKQ